MDEINLAEILAPDSDFLEEVPPVIADAVGPTPREDVTSDRNQPNELTQYSSDAPNYQEMVESLGGAEVVNALLPLLDADDADPVSTISQMLPAENLEALVWASLDSPETQAVVLQDPDVLEAISQHLFDGIPIQTIKDSLDYYGLADDEALEQYAQRQEEMAWEHQLAAQASSALQERFFVQTAAELSEQMNLSDPDTIMDAQIAAQGRFLNDQQNREDYAKLESLIARGLDSQARILEARLLNKWTAHLIKSFERHSSRAAHTRPKPESAQSPRSQSKSNGEQFDLSDPNFLADFAASFKAERQRRGL